MENMYGVMVNDLFLESHTDGYDTRGRLSTYF